jgi:hypothetical protein
MTRPPHVIDWHVLAASLRSVQRKPSDMSTQQRVARG